jgi:Methyltransferase domain
MSEQNTIPCRLCCRPSDAVFTKLVLARHRVTYYRCRGCGSLETAMPYWLDEAYAIPGMHIDVGGASRTIKNWIGLSTLLGRIGFPRDEIAMDFGAATGLLGRLMRDTGYNFHSYDKYAHPSFSSYYKIEDPAAAHPRLITAFEVFEHFAEPKLDLDHLLGLQAPLVIFTTWFCDGQPEDWIYFVPECGQHVFFYTEQAMRDVAATHGYQLRSSAFFHYLFKPGAFDETKLSILEDFASNCVEWARSEQSDLLSSVCMGNSYIDADFDAARVRFSAECAARSELLTDGSS